MSAQFNQQSAAQGNFVAQNQAQTFSGSMGFQATPTMADFVQAKSLLGLLGGSSFTSAFAGMIIDAEMNKMRQGGFQQMGYPQQVQAQSQPMAFAGPMPLTSGSQIPVVNLGMNSSGGFQAQPEQKASYPQQVAVYQPVYDATGASVGFYPNPMFQPMHSMAPPLLQAHQQTPQQ